MTITRTPEDYVAEIQRQTEEAAQLVRSLDLKALNWQPSGGESWSIGQCLEHLVLTDRLGLAAMQQAVASNRDQLAPRRAPMQPAGWLSRWFIGFIGPEGNRKVSAPSKIQPPSQVSAEVSGQFAEIQKAIADFVLEFREADLGAIRYKNPLAPINWTIDSGLLIFMVHNQRHLQQAERVKESAGLSR